MKLLQTVGLLLVGAAVWWIGEQLSADAIAMGIGVVIGMMASIPVALLVFAAQRSARPAAAPPQNDMRPAAPPLIILTGASYAPISHQDRTSRQHAALLQRHGPGYPPWRVLPDPADGENWT